MRLPAGYDGVLRPIVRLTLRPWRRADGTYLSRTRTLPIWLTAARLVIVLLAVPLGLAIHYQRAAIFVGLLALIYALFATDAIDGVVAREIGCVSDFGAVLDPLVDKIATAAVIAVWLVCAPTDWLIWLIPVIAVRVALDVSLAAVAQRERRWGLHPKAEAWGKWKFHADLTAIPFGLGGVFVGTEATAGLPLELTAGALVIAACILAGFSLRGHIRNLSKGKV